MDVYLGFFGSYDTLLGIYGRSVDVYGLEKTCRLHLRRMINIMLRGPERHVQKFDI